jgi:MoxR-like ATPase
MPAKVITVQGVPLTLAEPSNHGSRWIDYNDYVRQVEAAWLRLAHDELPLNPRIVGEPGLGKTTLACAAGNKIGRGVYIFQCTMDTRPEDLIITPVLTGDRKIEYRASAVVTAMITGAVVLLDEGNRMPERSWASLAPLMDDRRYVESEVAAIKVAAHPDFRLCVTMNADASVYELPGYIQSRLKPKIEVVAPPWETQEQIVRAKCAQVGEDLLAEVLAELKRRVGRGLQDSPRDMLTFAQNAQKHRQTGVDAGFRIAVPVHLNTCVLKNGSSPLPLLCTDESTQGARVPSLSRSAATMALTSTSQGPSAAASRAGRNSPDCASVARSAAMYTSRGAPRPAGVCLATSVDELALPDLAARHVGRGDALDGSRRAAAKQLRPAMWARRFLQWGPLHVRVQPTV